MKGTFQIFLFVTCLSINFLKGQDLVFAFGKHLKSSNGVSAVSSSTTDYIGNIYVTGYFSGTIDLDTSSSILNITSFVNSNSNCFIAKYSSSGDLVWGKVLNTSISSAGYSIAVDTLNNLYITGSFEGGIDFDPSPINSYNLYTSVGSSKMFLAKYDGSGNFIWGKEIGNNSFGNAVVTDGLNNIFVSGYLPGSYILSKYDTFGNLIWQNDFPQPIFHESSSIAVDSLNNIYFSFTFFNSIQLIAFSNIDTTLFSKGVGDIVLAKYSNNGNLLWVNQIGGPGYDFVRGNCIDASGDIVISGIFDGTVDFNSLGAASYLYHNYPEASAFLCKYNLNGVLSWARKITASTFLTPPLPVLYSNGDVFVTGNFTDSISFDSLASSSLLIGSSPLGSYFDIFLSQYFSNGDFKSAQQIASTNNNIPVEIICDYNDDLILVGYFDGLFDVDPSASFNYLYNPTANFAGYVVKYSTPVNSIDLNMNKDFEISCFPNPFNQNINIEFSEVNFSGIIYLSDSSNKFQNVYSIKNERSVSINTSDLVNGFYLLKLVNDKGLIQYSKLIKCN